MLAKKKNIIILVVSLAILGAIIATICVFLLKTQPAEIDPRSFKEIFWDSETSEEAIETFQKKIDATRDPLEKARLYTERSIFYFELPNKGSGLFKETILSDLENADSLTKSSESAYILYDRYSYYEDQEKAEYYYDLYINRKTEEGK